MKIGNDLTDWYYVKARLFPTALTVIPILFLYLQFIHPLIFNFSIAHDVIGILKGVAAWSAITFLLVHVTRSIGKFAVQKFTYDNEIKMPTTEYLLFSNHSFSKERKERIRSRITQKYSIIFSNEESEKEEELEARKKIIEGVNYVKNATRGNKAIEQHNREYGFVRNLTGGCMLAILFSLLGVVCAYNFAPESIINYSMLAAIYIVIFLWCILIIKNYGSNYAKILFEQFMFDS